MPIRLFLFLQLIVVKVLIDGGARVIHRRPLRLCGRAPMGPHFVRISLAPRSYQTFRPLEDGCRSISPWQPVSPLRRIKGRLARVGPAAIRPSTLPPVRFLPRRLPATCPPLGGYILV